MSFVSLIKLLESKSSFDFIIKSNMEQLEISSLLRLSCWSVIKSNISVFSLENNPYISQKYQKNILRI